MARVLFAHVSPLPDRVTGLSVYAWSILEALVRHGRHDYVLSTNWSADCLPEAIGALGIATVSRPNFRNESLAIAANSARLPALARRYGCAALFHPQPSAMLAGMGRSVVVVHDLYRLTHPQLFRRRQRAQWAHVTARGLARAGRLIAVSHATRQALVSAYPAVAGRVSVVHEASPIAVPVELPPAPPIAEPYGLVVGNIAPSKNIGLLAGALALLAARGRHPRIVAIGRDPMGALDRLKGRPEIRLTHMGDIEPAALLGYYAHARAFINTSLAEGFCLPVLEAQSFGLPVICSDLPVLREVAGEGALFVDPTDPAALADAIQAVFADERLRAALGGKGRANAGRFSWARAARETEDVIDALL